MNILALLDGAIEALARDTSSRSSREGGAENSPAGTKKAPDSAKLPALPALPVKNGDITGIPRKSVYGEKQQQSGLATTEKAFEAILFRTGSTGSTGTLKAFCDFFSSRKHQDSSAVTGSAGSIEDFRRFLDDVDPGQPPGDVPLRRWQQFIADTRGFLNSGFAAQATALGWTVTDLFGCDDRRPFARIDKMGLIWLLHCDRLVAIRADAAIIEAKSGARTTCRRRQP
jgi:hypothetical protein